MKRHIDLQLFAESQATSGDGVGAAQNGEGQSQGTEPKTYTEEELATLKAQWEKDSAAKHSAEIEKAKKEAVEEAQRVAKLSAEDKKAEEFKALENKVKLLEDEKAFSALKEEAREMLGKENLPGEFLDFVLDENTEKTGEKIKTLKKVFDDSLQKAVEERMKGKTPSGGGNTTTEVSVQEQFASALRR